MVFRKLIFLLFCIALQSCYTENKANRQVIRAQSKFSHLVAGNCAVWYPPGVFEKITTEYKPGVAVPVHDTMYVPVNCDSIVKSNPNADHSSVKAPCPENKLRVDTIFKTREVQIENTAKVDALQAKADKLTNDLTKSAGREKQLKEDLESMTKSRNLGWIIAGGLAVVIGVGAILKLKTKAT